MTSQAVSQTQAMTFATAPACTSAYSPANDYGSQYQYYYRDDVQNQQNYNGVHYTTL